MKENKMLKVEKFVPAEDDGIPDNACYIPDLSEEPWHTERWHEEDLVGAMEQAGVEISRANLDAMKKACVDIFADKSARNEMLADKARELFEEV